MPCLFAIEQDATGEARAKTLAYARGIGGTRAGVLETTFKEETETDLFGEQAVLCGGVSALVKAGFETLVEAGYQPELAYFECMHELKLIVDLMYQGGLNYMRYSVSDTAEFGDYVSGPRIVNSQTRETMKKILTEIQDGTFARRWIEENAAGRPNYIEFKQADQHHQIEAVGAELRQKMSWLGAKVAPDVPRSSPRPRLGPLACGAPSRPLLMRRPEGLPHEPGPPPTSSSRERGRNGGGRSEDRLPIFDTTLRDGEQSPGAAMNIDQKLQVAQQLERLGVDVIEAGFPNSSPGDFSAVSAIAEAVESVTVAGLARIWPEEDILKSADALSGAKKPRIHTFVGTSPLHRDMVSWAASPQEILERAVDAVKMAKSFVDDVEFSPMDASRTEKEYLADIIAATIEAGATTINVPDTVGYATPEEWHALMGWLYERVPGLHGVVLSIHCHDDLGLATANSLAAVRAGARQVECAINGIGERAGNASLEEIATAVRVAARRLRRMDRRRPQPDLPHQPARQPADGELVQPNKAIVGANAFAHASGIHQDGVLKDPRTFEIIDAEDVGAEQKLVLGKLSGRHAFRQRLEEMGYRLADEDFPARVRALQAAGRQEEGHH